ncbi:MAG: DUF21 domain-containing protein [Planctomycetales bacterium]|nr:DUF21 domain-containing protein [Planctomycetales bacterium]
MIGIAALFLGGMTLSAFFSGSETGFYRMTRLRLVMEAAEGDLISKGMLWIASQPSLFVATMLVGNNIANYVTSLAVVMGTRHWLPAGSAVVDLLVPIAVAPVLFIGGELAPKNLFFNAPNRLMRRAAPALAVCIVLFAPITVLLWLWTLLLKALAKQPPQEIRGTLARRELAQLMTEGHEAGILRPVQRRLAQNMLALAGRSVRQFATPSARVARVTTTMSRSEIMRIAQTHGRALLPMEDPRNKRQLVGFIRAVDVVLDDSADPLKPQPLVELSEDDTYLAALEKIGSAGDALARVANARGETLGFVTGRELRLALFRVQ